MGIWIFLRFEKWITLSEKKTPLITDNSHQSLSFWLFFNIIFNFLGAVDNDDPEEGEKKKTKRKKKSATVEKNLNNIDIAKFDLEFDVDPLFKKTSTQFDSGWFDN